MAVNLDGINIHIWIAGQSISLLSSKVSWNMP
jgi:hypothetical protein